MRSPYRLLVFGVLIGLATSFVQKLYPDSGESTRVVNPDQHVRSGPGGYPYRERSEYILRELDLKPGDVVVDIGAGYGWWAEKMATFVGHEGIVYAAEIDQNYVEKMKKKFADVPQIKPYLCQTDSTGLPANSCELAFLSQTYHHLNAQGRVDYLRHLREVVKPTGRVCVIEKYANIGTGSKHGTPLSRLVREAEEAGWIPVRCELITGTQYYIAVFVQKDLFGARKASHRSHGDTIPVRNQPITERRSPNARRFGRLFRRSGR